MGTAPLLVDQRTLQDVRRMNEALRSFFVWIPEKELDDCTRYTAFVDPDEAPRNSDANQNRELPSENFSPELAGLPTFGILK
jgi:hypothetical protein